MMKKLYSVSLLFLMITCAFANDIFYAEIFPEDQPGKLAYTHSNNVIEKGDSTIIEHYYFTPDGEKYVDDKVVLFKNKVVFNSVEFYQIKEYSSLKINGDKVELFLDKDGDKKFATRNLNRPLVFAPNQQLAIKQFLPELLSGKAVNFYIYASEVLRLVEMKIAIIENSPYERPDCVVLEMKPKSMFIDWFVDEVYYVVNKNNRRIMEMHGFSTLRQKVEDKWVFKDMDFYYSYK